MKSPWSRLILGLCLQIWMSSVSCLVVKSLRLVFKMFILSQLILWLGLSLRWSERADLPSDFVTDVWCSLILVFKGQEVSPM